MKYVFADGARTWFKSAPIGACNCNFPVVRGNHDRPSIRATTDQVNQQTDMRVHREVHFQSQARFWTKNTWFHLFRLPPNVTKRKEMIAVKISVAPT